MKSLVVRGDVQSSTARGDDILTIRRRGKYSADELCIVFSNFESVT